MKLEQEIITWAEEKGIFEKSTPIAQHHKTIEEVQEILHGILLHNIEEIKDGIGDTIVTLVIQAKMNGLTIDECVEHAYNIIKDRTGSMQNGLFVKD